MLRKSSTRTFSLALGLGLALSGALHARAEEPKTGADAGIRAQMEALDYKYEVDEDDDFRLVFALDNERSQILYVRSTVETYGEHQVREIWSPGYKSPTDAFPASIANRLLEASSSAKLGSWVKQGRNAVFVVKIPADASKEELDDAIDAAIKLADEMEAELSPGQDEL